MITAKLVQHFENFKFQNKFALISETVRDREKRTKFGDHMFCPCSHQNAFQQFALISETVRDRAKRNCGDQHKFALSQKWTKYWGSLSMFIVKHFSKNNLRIQILITMGMRCFCAQAQKQVDKCKIYQSISSFVFFL